MFSALFKINGASNYISFFGKGKAGYGKIGQIAR